MFSGIIDRLGQVADATFEDGALTCRVLTGYGDLELGESIAVNGVCLTVADIFLGGDAEFFASSETLARTNLGQVAADTKVNLERSVSLNTRLSGHMVQGHVDGMGKLVAVEAISGAWKLAVDIPASVARYCVEKGSIAIDGISLTINSLQDQPGGGARIGLMIIPHTWEHTTLHATAVGDALNIEVDVIAKYVERLCQPYPKP
ncbi:riboflavin synthase [Aestuariivirga litoralis]|uniref:riboflavin synthase n=1 Tax=Aestuariivirga litoralis TaxID=2650924 RepID=UPI0018C7C87C|nr:riboflavin synthase [Aestuariivirga litoralis]MBG1232086.1 riboflavin synthase [Aestuariivirga litoralis]